MIYGSAASIHADCVVRPRAPLVRGARFVIAAPSALRDANLCIIRARVREGIEW